MQMFPKDLALATHAAWDRFVAGDTRPPCPPCEVLTELLEVAAVASAFPTEGCYPRFNVIALPGGDARFRSLWRFAAPRAYAVAELRGLVPATDAEKSAIAVEWDGDGDLRIVGLCDLGASWHRARAALGYQYIPPYGLIVEVPRPGQLHVFQGEFKAGSLIDGALTIVDDRLDPHLSLHATARGGLADLRARIDRPEHEPEATWTRFETLALWNVYASIANLIAAAGHGGCLIVLPDATHPAIADLRIKYRCGSDELSEAFVRFVAARHRFMDVLELIRRRNAGHGDEPVTHLARQATGLEQVVDRTQDVLVETVRFTAQLANCDGALVIARDLTIVGFGAEIRAELRPGAPLIDVVAEGRRAGERLDVEVFGMRHRSAVKLVSQHPEVRVLVVSQDGPISAAWSDPEWPAPNQPVLFRNSINLANINLPWQ